MSERRQVIVEPDDPVAQQIDAMVMSDPVAKRAYFQQRAMHLLGRAIRAAREKADLTQTDLAKSAGMTQAEISRIENALPIKGVTLATLVNLSNALNFRIAFEFEKLPQELEVATLEQSEGSFEAQPAVRDIT